MYGSNLFNHVKNHGKITGMRVLGVNLLVSHLLFADDIFFYKTELRECKEVMKAIRIYGKHRINVSTLINHLLLFDKRIFGNAK